MNSGNLIVINHTPFTMEAMEGKDWQPVMDKGLAIMDDYSFKCQPGSGTLLGLMREEDGYIHHDTDIDIDVIISDVTDVDNKIILSLIESFEDYGFKLIRTQRYLGLPMQIAFVYEENNLIFDLCFFYNNWGTDYMNVYEHGVFVRPPYSVDSTVTHKFNGSEYIIPGDYERYLTGRFGSDWRTPKKDKVCGSKTAASYLIVL